MQRQTPKSNETETAERAPMTLPRLAEMKGGGEPIVMVTAYDHPSAQVAETAGVDVVLVGDTGPREHGRDARARARRPPRAAVAADDR